MTITDHITAVYLDSRAAYILVQGNETFYDSDRRLLEFGTAEAALDYARERLGHTQLAEFVNGSGKRGETVVDDLPLFSG